MKTDMHCGTLMLGFVARAFPYVPQHVPIFAAVPVAGPSWRPEVKGEYVPHAILESPVSVNGGQNMTGVENDGSLEILSAFCQSCITGAKAPNLVEEAYCSTMLCLLGNEAMEKREVTPFPDRYRIPYMKF